MTPPVASPASKSRNAAKSRLIWVCVILALIVIAAVITHLVLEKQRDDQYWAERYEQLRNQVSYRSVLFPASVTFQRGPTSKVEAHAKWEGHPQLDIATTSDDTEGRDYAEFHVIPGGQNAALPFADITHPLVKRMLETVLFFAKANSDNTAVFFNHALFVKEYSYPASAQTPDAWTIRITLLPSPYGAAIVPDGLTPEQLAQLSGSPAAPGEPARQKAVVDPRNAGSSGYSKYSTSPYQNAQRRAEDEADRQYRQDKRYHLNRYHHVYMVEAGRNFGDNRVIILRRIGQVIGTSTVKNAETCVLKMAESVKIEEAK
ncbi:MAG: hypothetical protein ACAI35_24365 [Candidatus Methylacidiphilales bacterium]|nr:hypothetical protein [Candidatus Methylacidiphilales bacterium]